MSKARQPSSVCELCSEFEEKRYKCKICDTIFCEFCGDIENRFCINCLEKIDQSILSRMNKKRVLTDAI